MSLGILTSTIRTLKNLKDVQYDQVLGLVSSRLIDETGDFSHILKRKSTLQLVLLSSAVCGIEFCYAAETAFVSPTLLKIGVPVIYMTLVWCLSPMLGFFLVPVLGSLSDKCGSKLGRRRPFILILSAGILIGLILVPYGENIGQVLNNKTPTGAFTIKNSINSTALPKWNNTQDDIVNTTGGTEIFKPRKIPHPMSIFLTILGVVLLDFSCDSCQSPCRAYLLDVSTAEDHPRGLSTFTVMAGLGGSLGYVMGGIDWNQTRFGESLGGHVRVVFTLVLLIYLLCVSLTVSAIKEVPLDKLGVGQGDLQKKKIKVGHKKYKRFTNETSDEEDAIEEGSNIPDYGSQTTIQSEMSGEKPPEKRITKQANLENGYQASVSQPAQIQSELPLPSEVTLKHYLKSIVRMPKSLLILCLTNLFCWMSLVCYSLYFTDFVGQAVFRGDPSAPSGSREHELYEAGVRWGSFGMSLYSVSCSAYSLCLEQLVNKFGARPVYISSQLVYTFGALLMICLPHPTAVILLSPCAGVMYATLFTMPYLLVAHYHSSQTFGEHVDSAESSQPNHAPILEIRGLGTDVAIVSSMVFVAQFLLSSCMGSIVHGLGTTKAVMGAAAILSACGAAAATQVVYLNL